MSHLVNIHTHRFCEDGSIQILSVDYQLILSQKTLESSNRFYSASIHPMHWKSKDEIDLNSFSSLLNEKSVLAIGESGLDKNSLLSTEDQLRIFKQQQQLSIDFQKPIVIHCVGRWNELELLFKTKKTSDPAWIIHGFRKTSIGNKFLGLGALFGLGSALLFDEKLQNFVKSIPIDRIFLETDDSELEILEVYEKLASIKCLPLQAVIEQVYTNYLAVFHHGALA